MPNNRQTPEQAKADAIKFVRKAADSLSLVYHRATHARDSDVAGAGKALLLQIANALESGDAYETELFAIQFDGLIKSEE